MIETRIIMGMPVIVEIIDDAVTHETLDTIFSYFEYVDATFSTYKDDSEISRINRGELTPSRASSDVQLIFALSEQTKRETDGYFEIDHNSMIDPSGIVKGWAIHNAAEILRQKGFRNFYVDAGGDIEVAGNDKDGKAWRVGIQNPFNTQEIVKVLSISDVGIATSGTYVRGQHVYNPKKPNTTIDDIVSLTVIGSNIYEADRFATAAFAMGQDGIVFIESLKGFEGYMINVDGIATYTSGFTRYISYD